LLQGGGLLALPARLHRHEGLTRRIAGDAAPRPGEQVGTIRRGQRVVCLDGPIGRVDLVLVDAVNDRVQHIVVRQGLLFSRDVAVPADWVHSITPHAVLLEAPREAVARLPVYRPDDELQRDVEEALLSEELIRVLDVPIRVQVEDGIVQLRGYVPNSALRHRVEELVRSVPGVVGIQHDLVVDLELLQWVTTAIQGHPRARHLVGHQVRVKNGVVELTGGIPSLEAAEALEEAIASAPEVRGIANLLIGPDIPASWRRVLQPEIGQVVAATDQEVGRVSAVVIDPRHRRLLAIVVDGDFPEPGTPPDAGATTRARRVVIPLSAVDRVTPAGIFLRVHAGRAAGYPDFDDADYPPAPPDWIPPFPYERSHVRVPRDGAERP
jgi:sporulation protein YlmC with PRC-barrel domain